MLFLVFSAAIALSPVAGAAENLLAGTTWRLVEIQSMDDAVGTKTPEDRSRFTMRLNADGTVNMALDCNRAKGTWTAEPSADPWSGRFEFGPLATTRALCPPPRLDEEITRQAPYVRGYLLKNGRLYLSLMADGGIYGWEPDEPEVGFDTEPDPALEGAIRAAAPDYTEKSVEILGHEARYLHGEVDLDHDGRSEVLAYLLGPFFCGTGGCNLMLFRRDGEGYTLVNDFPTTDLPVIVSSETTEGWSDLVRLQTGGGVPSSYVRHVFDGERYVEAERLSGNMAPSGTRLLAGEFTFEDGIVLEPEGGSERGPED